MIEVEGLTKYYGPLAAVKDVSFRVESGEIVGFLGLNGAGKTTTMRILTCFSPPSSGTARVLGMDVATDSLKIRSKVGYLPENVPLYDWMRVQGYLKFVARAKGIPAADARAEITRVVDSVGLDGVKGKLIRMLSKGFRQRVGLAQALLGDPPVLILDEPTIGLDPRQIREIRQLIKGLARDRTVMLSTHILPEVSQICDRVIIINQGSVLKEGTLSSLTRAHGDTSRSQAVFIAPEQEAVDLVGSVAGVVRVHPAETLNDGQVRLTFDTDADPNVRAHVAKSIFEKGWNLLELRPMDATLEDIFIHLVRREAGDGAYEEQADDGEVMS